MREAAPSNLEESILAFGRSWYKYGGGSEEDIYVQFGLSARSYFERLAVLLDHARLELQGRCVQETGGLARASG